MSFKAIDCKMKEIYYENLNVVYNDESEIEAAQQDEEALLLRSLRVMAMQNITCLQLRTA